MKIIKPNLSFNISHAARSWPKSQAITNLDILRNFPRTAHKSAAILEKLDEKITEEFGFNTRYLSHLPWEPLDLATETSESLAIDAVRKILLSHPTPDLEAFILGSTTNKRYTGSQASAVLGEFAIAAPAYDLKVGCSTSLASLHLAYALMALGYQNILVSCAETLSKVMDPKNEKTWLGVAEGKERSNVDCCFMEQDFAQQCRQKFQELA